MKKANNKKGITFFEVLVTAAIFSFGVTMIYSSFLTSLDYIGHLKNRLYAVQMLDNHIALLEYKLTGNSRFFQEDAKWQESVDVVANGKDFTLSTELESVEGLADIIGVKATVSWMEQRGSMSLSRISQLSNSLSLK